MIQCCFPALYRLVNKAHLGQQAVDRSSALVTADIFKVQSFLTKRFLEQISKASMHERDNLRQWRRVIQLNTHPRYTASSTLFTKSAGSMLCTSEWWTFVVTLFPIYCVIDTLMSTLLFYSPPPPPPPSLSFSLLPLGLCGVRMNVVRCAGSWIPQKGQGEYDEG